MNTVSIITVNYNQPRITEALLHSITPCVFIKEIIVVDNGSKIDPVPSWRITYPNVHFIRSENNLGFAGGNNLGISHATGIYYFFVNNDTEFTSSVVGLLVREMDLNSMLGMVSPRINFFSEKTKTQYDGYTPMNFYRCQNRCIGIGEENMKVGDLKISHTGYVHGAAMMVRAAAVDRAGLMDEIFFLYYEEFDWCERIRKQGYEIAVCHHALIYHKESVSVGKNSKLKEYYMNRNRILFIRRNAGVLERRLFYIYFAAFVMPRNIIRYLISGNYEFIAVLFRAVSWNLFSSHSKRYARL